VNPIQLTYSTSQFAANETSCNSFKVNNGSGKNYTDIPEKDTLNKVNSWYCT
jgi:hypothetical protein